MISRKEFLQYSSLLGISMTSAYRLLSAGLFRTTQDIAPLFNFSLWYLRPEDLIDFEFGFINLEKIPNSLGVKKRRATDPAYMLVRLPQLHVAEETIVEEGVDRFHQARSYVAGYSYLVFQFKPHADIGNFTLTEANLLNWKSSNFYDLVTLTPENYLDSQVSYEKGNRFKGITVVSNPNSQTPVTTFEAPYGLSLSPIVSPNHKLGFKKDNKVQPPSRYYFPNPALGPDSPEAHIRDNYYAGLATIELKPEIVDKYADTAKINLYTELWYNDLVVTAGKTEETPSFKAAGFDPTIDPNDQLLPTKDDKQTLFEQFRPDLSPDDPIVRSKLDKTILDKEIITTSSPQYRLSPFGLIASMEYISPDLDAIIQKVIEEIRLGRDQYLEVQRLGYMYPLNIRVVVVVIGQRKIRDRISYIERKTYIAPLDKLVTYRTTDEQNPDSLDSSVLQRVATHDQKDTANYVRSCKRSFPFQQLEVLTKGFIQIMDVESTVRKKNKDELKTLQTKYDAVLKGSFSKLTDFLAVLHVSQADVLKNDQLTICIGGDLLQLSIKAAGDADYVNNEFATLVSMLADIKQWATQVLAELAKPVNTPFVELQKKTQLLVNEMAPLTDLSILTIQNDVAAVLRKTTDKDIISIAESGVQRVAAFWPKLENGNGDVTFDFRAIDWDGNKINFSAPFVVIAGDAVHRVNRMTTAMSQLATDIGAAVDLEMLYLRQDLLEWTAQINAYLAKSSAELARVNTEIDQLKQRANNLLIQLHNQSDNLLNALKDRTNAVVMSILELRQKEPQDFVAARNAAEAAVNGWADNKEKGLYLIYTSSLLYQLKYVTSPSAKYDSLRGSLQAQLNDLSNKAKQLCGGYSAQVGKQWYAINQQLNHLDEQLLSNYHSAANDERRQIKLYQAKIAFYRSKLEAAAQGVQDAEQKINELQTELIEFTAIPIAQLATLRQRVANFGQDAAQTAAQAARAAAQAADADYQRMKAFGQQFTMTYPQLLSATVQLPVVKEMMNGYTAVIAYADAYKVAGIEKLQQLTSAEEGAKRNAEQILFEIRQPLAKEAAEIKTAFDTVHAEVSGLADGYRKDIQATWQTINKKQQDFQASTTGYVKGKAGQIFAAAQEKVGGLVNPGVVIEKISAIKGMAYTLGNEVDFNGTIKRYSSAADGFLNSTHNDVTKFEDNIKGFAIDQKGKISSILDDLKLFGIPLSKVLNVPTTFTPSDLPDAQIKIIKRGPLPIGSEVSYCWSPSKGKQLFKTGDGGFIKFIDGVPAPGGGGPVGGGGSGDHAALNLCLVNKTSFDNGGENRLTSTIELNNFGLTAADVITISFKNIKFLKEVVSQKSGADWNTTTNSSVKINIQKVEFSGFLDLIKQLQESLGLGDGFLLQADTEGITLSYGIRVPAICTGAFTMSNINLYAGLVLKFKDDPPALRFAFAEKSNPFTMAVGVYGGRGFFGMNVSSRGIELIEASLEFGAYIALDIAGIARGQAYLMAGIYFRKRSGESVYVESYVVCGGSLSIIGLIQISIVFYLGMSYQDGALRGRASVEVSIKVLFFSASYNLTFEKQITGKQGLSGTMSSPLPEQMLYASLDEHGPQAPEFEQGDDPPAANAPIPFCYLYTASNKSYTPIYDPTVLYEHEMEFSDYAKQFSN